MSDLRQELRAGTRAAHDRVDSEFRRYRLDDRNDYGVFLLAHDRAYRSLDRCFATRLPDAMRPPRMSALLERDLARMDIEPAAAVGCEDPIMREPLGAAYVVGGSHFGLKVLRRHWLRSDDPVVLSAGAYLSSDSMSDYWPKLLGHLRTMPVSVQRRINIVNSADATFRLFLTALKAARLELSAIGTS